MKKVSVILLTIVLLLTSITYVFAETSRFTDLSTSHWAYDNVILLVDLGVINGYGDGTFKPNNNISVAEFIKLMLCATGNDVGNVVIGKWYLNYINEAKRIGLIEEGEFTNYDNYITRAEMSKIVVNALGANYAYPENLTDYIKLVKDYNLIDDEYKDYILKAYSLGILTGNGDGTFRPINFALRTEASTIVARLIFPDKRILPDLEPKEEETNTSSVAPFTFYDEIQLRNLTNYNSSPTSSGYRVENNSIIFNGGGTITGEDYVVSEILNPDINRQLYELTETLIDKDHYVYTFYNGENITGVSYGKGKASILEYGISFFDYYFYEYTPYNAREDGNYDEFSEDVFISLKLNTLYWDWENRWSMDYYEDKLRNSLIIVFGEITGAKIYDYVFDQYMIARTEGLVPDTDGDPYNNYLLYTKEIDNIHIDYIRNNTLSFKFSYID